MQRRQTARAPASSGLTSFHPTSSLLLPVNLLLTDLGLIMGAGLLGALPLLRKRSSERWLHTALGLSTGVFLGALFLHLLPQLATRLQSGDAELSAPLLWGSVLAGALLLGLLRALALRPHGHDELQHHRAVGFGALTGLSLHAFTAGLGYAVLAHSHHVAQPMLLAIVGHKAFESFSLTTLLQLAGLARARVFLIVFGFALLTPLGALLADTALVAASPALSDVLLGLATGTFLYVCLAELLPEVFHHREDVLAKVTLLGLGVGAMALLELGGEHAG
ncbi:MAG: hypothetical protein DHS20C15_24130 [Planctomycetota bacterium]|nr:MAG: hypothetical protein DHS20C15_24130 [Planctomycetota bacterium]